MKDLSPKREISPASAINPDTALIESPAVPAAAGSIASLPHQAHAVARIGGAIISTTIVGRAGDD